MDMLPLIQKRRSVREYLKKSIPRKDLEKIVDAARFAPTARNLQPWEFVMVTRADVLKQIADITDHGKFIAVAPACLAVFGDNGKYYLEDCCAAIENAMLEAASLKIGSCWVAGDKKPYAAALNVLLGVPDKFKLVGLIALGYPLASKALRIIVKRKLEDVLHWERF
ncbi:MAG: nitroreductase family protein [Candidatus Omnitrophota bacterium]